MKPSPAGEVASAVLMAKAEADAVRERRAEALEALVELYLRLNGYFTIPNYLYHRSEGFGLRSESDVLAIRMPHQVEVLPGGDRQPFDPSLVVGGNWIDCIVAEVKEGEVTFNRSVQEPSGVGLIEDAMRMFGQLPEKAFETDGGGRRMAQELHGQIVKPEWPHLARAESAAQSLCVHMIVFAPARLRSSRRAFVTLDDALVFVAQRMERGRPCVPYRDQRVSPWRGTKRLIVEALDRAPHTGVSMEQLLEDVTSHWHP